MVIPTPGIDEDGGPESGPDFTDPPLDPIVQDNLEVDIIIGGRPYLATQLEVHLTEGPESNYAIGHVRGDNHDFKPSEGDPLLEDSDPDIITIDVDNELAEERTGADEEITRLFTGVISNSSRVESGLFEFMAFWPGFNKIQNEDIIVSHTPPKEAETEHNGNRYVSPVYQDSLQFSEDLAIDVAEAVTPDREEFGYSVNLKNSGWNIGGKLYGINTQIKMEGFVVPITVEGNDEGVLTRIVNASNAVWEVDRYGQFNIGPPVPASEIILPTSTTAHKLRYITETSAGLQSPAYRSIAVIGDGVVSQDGWGASAQLNENPQEYADAVTDTFRPDRPSNDLAEPTFEYTNLEINTAAEAEHVLSKLQEEIRKQMASGEITVVGHPEIWPGDAVELPDTENQPFGLERFGVSKVVHRLNNSDGFLTKIEVMGQTNAAETTFAVDPETGQVELGKLNEDRYDSYYSEDEIEAVEQGRRGL